MNYKQSILSAAIVASLGFAAQLHAQEATQPASAPAATDATDLDTIVVTGTNEALRGGQDLIRRALVAEPQGGAAASV